MNSKQLDSESQRQENREISAGILVYRKTQEGPKFLILYHGHDYWNFPKGKIENEEKSFEAAVRETREETGLTTRNLRFLRNFKTYERFSFRRNGKTVYKVVIFYMAETNEPRIKISKEHQGYGWFLYREASRILGKYKDSQKVLKNAYDFLQRKSHRSSQAYSQRPNFNLQRSGTTRRQPASLAGSRQHHESLRRNGQRHPMPPRGQI